MEARNKTVKHLSIIAASAIAEGDRIQRYNQAISIKITQDSGYHKTITLFWVRIVLRYPSALDANCSIVELEERAYPELRRRASSTRILQPRSAYVLEGSHKVGRA